MGESTARGNEAQPFSCLSGQALLGYPRLVDAEEYWALE
jgi:hypothetical protein